MTEQSAFHRFFLDYPDQQAASIRIRSEGVIVIAQDKARSARMAA